MRSDGDLLYWSCCLASYGIELSAVPAGAGIVWVGTLLYNSSCITPAVLASLTANVPAHTLAALLQWAVRVPNIIAGCFFVLGSCVAWACAARSFSLLHIWQQCLPIGSFWAYALYLMVRSSTRHIQISIIRQVSGSTFCMQEDRLAGRAVDHIADTWEYTISEMHILFTGAASRISSTAVQFAVRSMQCCCDIQYS